MSHQRRYDKTLAFIRTTLSPPARILDIGTPNVFSEQMMKAGYSVVNTRGEDLDDDPAAVQRGDADAATAFEIFEHLLNPLGVLRHIQAPVLYASVPLRLWFAPAYRHPTNRWDQHFHEFEDWQFDWLLEKSGWTIVRSEKWTSPVKKPGIRPILRLFTPRYYIVEAHRTK
jgi:hypothetical protein